MTSTPLPSPSTLTDDDLLCEAQRLARRTHEETTALVRVLIEVDKRRLYLREGCASLFAWCVQMLRLDEGGAYNRIEVARVARRLPAVLDALESGAVTLTAARLLAPHLTDENHVAVLTRAHGRTTREVHVLVAELSPRPPVPTFVRRLGPAKARALPDDNEAPASDVLLEGGNVALKGLPPTDSAARAAAATAAVEPLSSTRYKLQMTIASDTHAKIRHAQNLLRHTIPTCTVVDVLDRALSVLVRELERQRCGLTRSPRLPRSRPSPGSRHIPAFVRRAVWQRDDAQCAYVGVHGRCRERAWLEFHHIVPHAAGGPASVENISLRCRAHNAFEGEQLYGTRRRTQGGTPPARAVPTGVASADAVPAVAVTGMAVAGNPQPLRVGAPDDVSGGDASPGAAPAPGSVKGRLPVQASPQPHPSPD